MRRSLRLTRGARRRKVEKWRPRPRPRGSVSSPSMVSRSWFASSSQDLLGCSVGHAGRRLREEMSMHYRSMRRMPSSDEHAFDLWSCLQVSERFPCWNQAALSKTKLLARHNFKGHCRHTVVQNVDFTVVRTIGNSSVGIVIVDST